MADDDHRCVGWPAERQTVRPKGPCQTCERWKQLGNGGERTPRYAVPPGMWDHKRGEFFCAHRIT